MYDGRESVREVADMAANLPRGGVVSEWLGGWGAVTAEEEALRRLEHLMNVRIMQASGKKRPVPSPKPPESVRDLERTKKLQAAKAAKKAAALARMSSLYGG